MSMETAQWLNTQTLIGNTAQRGNAWHYRAELQGAESNHYEGAIPVADVQRRLFNWHAVTVPVQALLPATTEDFTTMDAEGKLVKAVDIPNMVAIARSDNGFIFPRTFSSGYRAHQYDEWLLKELSNILGDTLAISSAGLLKNGAIAWVEVSVPETIHDERTGFAYRPNILAGTSFDGSLATTYGRTVTATVCDNTMSAALGQMGEQQKKVRHSKYSSTKGVREALSIVHETGDEFSAQLHALTERTVTDRQWFSFLDALMPLEKDGEPLKGAPLTRTERQRDEIQNLWRHDNRVAPWANTEFGVIQAVNTWTHHYAEVRNTGRTERNMERAIKGKVHELDSQARTLIESILSNA